MKRLLNTDDMRDFLQVRNGAWDVIEAMTLLAPLAEGDAAALTNKEAKAVYTHVLKGRLAETENDDRLDQTR